MLYRPARLTGLLLVAILPLASQNPTEQQYIASVTSAINNLVPSLGNPTHKIVFGGVLVAAVGSLFPTEPQQWLVDYVDGLKAAGVQRVEINPGVTTMSDPGNVAKMDAVVGRIRQLGLELAFNPTYFTGETKFNNFQEFQTQALSEYKVLAARYHPENFVIIHEPVTATTRLGFSTTVSDWHNFVLAASPIIKAASPYTRVGAGDYYNPHFAPVASTMEDSYFNDFATIPPCNMSAAGEGCLDFLTMNIYNTDFSTFIQWANLAHATGKGVYIAETWAPQDLPNPVPQGTGEDPDTLSLIGPANADFAQLDMNWLHAMALFASAYDMEALTAFTTEPFFLYGTPGSDKPSDNSYWIGYQHAILQGQLTPTAQAFLADRQALGIPEAVSISSASYATTPSVFTPNCGAGNNPCYALAVTAPDDLVSAFGTDLATTTALDGTFPTTLGGTQMTLLDSTNTTYPVPLYFVSPGQVNYYVPTDAKPGPATLTITSGDGTQSKSFVMIAPVMPGLYTENQNGEGVAAAIAICAGSCSGWPNTLPNGQFYQNVFVESGGTYVPQPIHVAAGDTVVLELYGTGLRHVSSTSVLSAEFNQQSVPVLFAGAQGQFTGLDQVNVQVPANLAGGGTVNLVLTVKDPVNQVNATSNTVTIAVE